jgi:hypothetical protein
MATPGNFGDEAAATVTAVFNQVDEPSKNSEKYLTPYTI